MITLDVRTACGNLDLELNFGAVAYLQVPRQTRSGREPSTKGLAVGTAKLWLPSVSAAQVGRSSFKGMGLEVVVSKRKDRPYKSGKLTDWVKVKTPSWREANAGRWENIQARADCAPPPKPSFAPRTAKVTPAPGKRL